jgi:hypothetical protein
MKRSRYIPERPAPGEVHRMLRAVFGEPKHPVTTSSTNSDQQAQASSISPVKGNR